MASCLLNDIIVSLENCEENFSGIGSRIYIALVSDLTKGDVKRSDSAAEFTKESFSSLNGHLYAVDIKEETGKVTYTTNPDGGGFVNQVEFTVAKNMADFSFDLRTLNNVKFLAFAPDGTGAYYVFYSVMGSAKLDSTGDTGAAATDEHGHTTTISAGPMYYPLMRYCPVGSDDKPIDLDEWLASAKSGGE